MPLIREPITIPERVHQGDFLLSADGLAAPIELIKLLIACRHL
jgi:hypothetical protein